MSKAEAEYVNAGQGRAVRLGRYGVIREGVVLQPHRDATHNESGREPGEVFDLADTALPAESVDILPELVYNGLVATFSTRSEAESYAATLTEGGKSDTAEVDARKGAVENKGSGRGKGKGAATTDNTPADDEPFGD